MGLNDALRTNILSMEPIPTIKNVIQTHDISAVAVDRSAVNYNALNPSGIWKREKKKARLDDRWCGYCKRHGYTKENCFKLHPEQRINFLNRNTYDPGQKQRSGGQKHGTSV
ncbi:hypothetical protein RND81_10G006700 [Saponaria officinalis]|uniref:Uncharacterized protein n=1 Tax=Saponaria officinalis TaxID=3572 RepID=A0AAW1HX19_SAPOF